MWGPGSREEWIETVGLAAAAGALYASGLFALLFLLPLEALVRRRGFPALVWASGIAILAVLVVDGVRLSRLSGGLGSPWLLVWNWTLPLSLLVGLLVVEGSTGYLRRGLYRLAAGWATALAVTVPVFAKVLADGSLRGFLERQLEALGFAAEAEGNVGAGVEDIAATALGVLGNTYGFGLLFMLLVNWYLGAVLGYRFSTGVAAPARLDRFAMPADSIWALSGSIAALALGLAADLRVIEAVGWNLSLAVLTFYALQGIAVIRHLLQYYRLQQGVRMAVVAGVIILLFVPGLNVIVLFGVPGLGVSEHWIDYHRFERRG